MPYLKHCLIGTPSSLFAEKQQMSILELQLLLKVADFSFHQFQLWQKSQKRMIISSPTHPPHQQKHHHHRRYLMILWGENIDIFCEGNVMWWCIWIILWGGENAMIYGPGHSLGFHYNKWPLFSKHFDEDVDDDLFIYYKSCVSVTNSFSKIVKNCQNN